MSNEAAQTADRTALEAELAMVEAERASLEGELKAYRGTNRQVISDFCGRIRELSTRRYQIKCQLRAS